MSSNDMRRKHLSVKTTCSEQVFFNEMLLVYDDGLFERLSLASCTAGDPELGAAAVAGFGGALLPCTTWLYVRFVRTLDGVRQPTLVP